MCLAAVAVLFFACCAVGSTSKVYGSRSCNVFGAVISVSFAAVALMFLGAIGADGLRSPADAALSFRPMSWSSFTRSRTPAAEKLPLELVA